MRNTKLDIFRGLAMIWVILVHCLYWLGFFSWYKSFLLIEMSLFFFIAGSSNGMASKKSLGSFYLTRFQRIMIPYWIYEIICIILISIIYTPETIKSLWGWINPWGAHWSPIPYLTWALWFVPVYVLVMLVFPLLQKIRNTHLHYLPFIVLVLLIVALNFWEISGKISYYAKMLVFYSFFTYLGLYFTEITKKIKLFPALAVIIIGLLLMFVLVTFFGQSLNMQYNKFPPNCIFLFYSLVALAILYICSDVIVKAIQFLKRNAVFNWIYQQYEQRGLTIFLFHPFVFLLLNYLKKTCLVGVNPTLSFAIIFLLAIPLAAVAGKMFSWVEHTNIFSIKERKKTQKPDVL
ncbi:MAG: acyltransferase [Bacteroidales bacterium]|jgi:fucose 4-O-acetylase-like acetyltransferase|nr:acyltransferase [Bacteroidales bacterium]